MSDNDETSTDFDSIRRIREAAAMGQNQGNSACSAQQGTTCTFIAAQDNLTLTLKELTRGQRALDEKLSFQNDTLHKIEIRLERGDSALANASGLARDVEDLKLQHARSENLVREVDILKEWKAKTEGSAMMAKWLIGLAVGGGAAGVISIIMFLAKGHP
jgi:hypothetical protein